MKAFALGVAGISFFVLVGCGNADLVDSGDSNDELTTAGPLALAADGAPQALECDPSASKAITSDDIANILRSANAPIAPALRGASIAPQVIYAAPPTWDWAASKTNAVLGKTGLVSGLVGSDAKWTANAPMVPYLVATADAPQVLITNANPQSIRVDSVGNITFLDSAKSFVAGPCALNRDGSFECTMSVAYKGSKEEENSCYQKLDIGSDGTTISCNGPASGPQEAMVVNGFLTKSCVSFIAKGYAPMGGPKPSTTLVGGKFDALSR